MAFSAASPASSITGIGDLFLTIRAGAKLRVEPQVGWHHDAASFVASDPTNPINGEHITNTVFLLGVGLFATNPSSDGKTTLYYGPRIGMAWVKSRTRAAGLTERMTPFITAT